MEPKEETISKEKNHRKDTKIRKNTKNISNDEISQNQSDEGSNCTSKVSVKSSGKKQNNKKRRWKSRFEPVDLELEKATVGLTNESPKYETKQSEDDENNEFESDALNWSNEVSESEKRITEGSSDGLHDIESGEEVGEGLEETPEEGEISDEGLIEDDDLEDVSEEEEGEEI